MTGTLTKFLSDLALPRGCFFNEINTLENISIRSLKIIRINCLESSVKQIKRKVFTNTRGEGGERGGGKGGRGGRGGEEG